MKSKITLAFLLAVSVLSSLPSLGEATVYEPPPLSRKPYAWVNGSYVIGSKGKSLFDDSHTISVGIGDGGTGLSSGGIVSESARYNISALGGHSPLVRAYAGVGNFEHPTGCYGDASAHAYGANIYYFLAGSRAGLLVPPALVSIVFSYELGVSGSKQGNDNLSIGGQAKIKVQSLSGQTFIDETLITLNQQVVRYINLDVPFNQWIEVWTFADANAHNRNTWVADPSNAEVDAYTDPTIVINPNFPNANLFHVKQVKVASPASALIPSIQLLLLGD